MTMHLHHPALSTTGKKKGKFKWASAEAKRQAEELESNWKNLLKRQGIESEEKKQKRGLNSKAYTLPSYNHRGSDAPPIPSLNSGLSNAFKAPPKVYTGNEVVGISVMHKSCLQPVFSQEAAIDAAKMRR